MHKSRIYSFLDNKSNYTWHFFEGQRTIEELALLHGLTGSGFAFLRELVLTGIPMLTFLKNGEQLGFYIDSDEPNFKFKIEMHNNGQFRTLLIPHGFNKFPDKLTGQCRLVKILPRSTPYTSILPLDKTKVNDITNQILQDSYQVESTVKLSDVTDQSVMLVKLPLADGMSEDLNIPLKNYLKDRESFIHDLFEANFNDIEAIVKYFEDRGVSYLGSKEIVFHCPCSQEQMVTSLKGLSGSDINELYKEDKSIEINCDYCGKQYKVTREDIEF